MNYIVNKLYRARRRQRVLRVVLLVLAVALAVGIAVFLHNARRTPELPTFDEALCMDDATLMEAIRSFSREDLIEAWGEPISDVNPAWKNDFCMIWKSDDSLDHVYVYLDRDTRSITGVSVVYVFEALTIFVGEDRSWATVTPCEGEDELAYGDLLKVNLIGRYAVLVNMHEDPNWPVRIYYKGSPHPSAGDEPAYIDTVINVSYYDNTLEPIIVD